MDGRNQVKVSHQLEGRVFFDVKVFKCRICNVEYVNCKNGPVIHGCLNKPNDWTSRTIKVERGCKTCEFAQWERRTSGRIRKDCCGRCKYKVEWPPVPFFVNNLPSGFIEALGRWDHGIWPDTGGNCECWKWNEKV